MGLSVLLRMQFDLKSRLRQCLNACASEFHGQKYIAEQDGKYLKKGCLEEIIKKQKKLFKLSNSINKDKEVILFVLFSRQPYSNINRTNVSNGSF